MTRLWERKNLLQISLIALAIGLGVIVMILTGVNNTAYVDAEDYIYAAQSLLQHGIYPDSVKFPLFRPPLYPLILASVWSVFPGSIVAVKLIQIVLHGLTCWLVFKIAFEITEDNFLSFVSGLIFAVNPLFLYNATGTQTESIHTFLVTLPLFLMVRMIMSRKVDLVKAIVVGLFYGLAALCKPTALGIGLFLMVTFFLLLFRVKGSFKASAVMAVVMFLTILPWSFYILKTRGEFFLITDAGGFNLWQGNNPNWIPIFRGDFATAEEADAHHKSIERENPEQIAVWETTHNYSSLTLHQREALWRDKAVERMAADPAAALQLFALKFYILWKPLTNPFSYSMSKTILSALTMVPIYIFGFWGILQMRRNEKTKKVVWLFLAVAVSMTIVHVAILCEIRYRLPYVDPMLMVFAGIALGGFLLKWAPKLKFANDGLETSTAS